MFPGLGVWLALLLAAALAPTDAGLGAATVLNPVVPVRVRRVLNVESGLNDGLATPVVLFAVAAAAGTADGSTGARVRQGAGGDRHRRPSGLAAGFLSGRLLDTARRPGLVAAGPGPGGGARRTAAVATTPPIGCGGNGFIAAFVAGTMFALAQVDLDRMHADLELTDQVAALLGFAVWMLFGTADGHPPRRASCSGRPSGSPSCH